MPLATQLRLPLDDIGVLFPLPAEPVHGPAQDPRRGPGPGEHAATPPPAVVYVRNPRARHYVVRVRDDGSVRITIPRGGSARGAEEFFRRQAAWIARQQEQLRKRPPERGPQSALGDHMWLRGVRTAVVLVDGPCAALRFADQTVPLPAPCASPRAAIAARLRALASRELPARLMALASNLGLAVPRVTIRDQRSRWGSCSPGGAISLNWRLLQMPDEVRDYVMLHELMHLRRLDHSRAFWRLVRDVCPWYREARLWLRRHGRELL